MNRYFPISQVTKTVSIEPLHKRMLEMNRTIRTALDLFKYGVFIAALIVLLGIGVRESGYYWQWYRIPKYIFSLENGHFSAGPLLEGLLITIKITAVSFFLAFAFGMITAFLRLSNAFIAHFTARIYLESIRNTPLLIQLFFIYFVLAPVLDISAFTSAVLALSLFEGAYASEIIRAGIVSIDKGQWEAAYSLGIDTKDTYRFIILPQAFRRILPPLAGQAISLVKDSALVSTIAIYDLTMQGQAIVSETFLTFEIWFTVAAIYLMLTFTLSLIVNLIELKLKTPA